MKTATIVGAGIGGPVAALALSNAGYEVTLHEERSGPQDFNSFQELTLQHSVFSKLQSLGIPESELVRYDGSAFVRDLSSGRKRSAHESVPWTPQQNVMWNDLHDALVKRCTVTYGSKVTTVPETDLVVWSDGVGSLGRKWLSGREGTYAGEMLFRGFVPGDNLDWYMSASQGYYEMVSYPCWDRTGAFKRGWTLFLAREPQPWEDTETLSPAQQDRLNRRCYPIMHEYPYSLISGSEETIGSPQLVWDPVNTAVYRRGDTMHYVMGDALGSVSPRTTMGASLAVTEGFELGQMSPRMWEREMTRNVNYVLSESKQYIRTGMDF